MNKIRLHKGGVSDEYIIMLSHIVTIIGHSAFKFGSYVYIFEVYDSISVFSLFALLGSIPGIVFSPFAGKIVDRFQEDLILRYVDILWIATIFLLSIALINIGDSFLFLGGAVVILSIIQAIQWPAANAAIARLAKSSKLTSINGYIEGARGVAQLMGPFSGFIIVSTITFGNMFWILIIIHLLSLFALYKVRLSTKKRTIKSGSGFFSDCSSGIRWIFEHKSLRLFLLFFIGTNFFNATYSLCVTPYVLDAFDKDGLLYSQVVFCLGVILGGGYLAFMPKYVSELNLVFLGACVLSIGMILIGICGESVFFYMVFSLVGFSIPVINGCSQTIWQVQVPSELMGRVFAARRMVAWCTNPIAYIAAFPMSEWIYNTLLDSSFSLESFMLSTWGGRNYPELGVMIVVCGVGVLVNIIFLMLCKRMNEVAFKKLQLS